MEQDYVLPPEDVSNEAIAKRLTSTAIEEIRAGRLQKRNLVWLELTGCSGNIISMMNGTNPDLQYLITSMVNLRYSNSLMVAEGEKAMQILQDVLEEEFILAVEGAVALRNNGMYHVIGTRNGEPVTALQAAQMLGAKASHVIAVGACATHGGPSAAKPNPAQCVGLPSVLNRKVIKLPGCPCHPDWFLGTLAHLLLYGEPALDNRDRPLMFYSTLLHDRCPRLDYFHKGIFAKTLGEPTCLFKLGCRGPVTRIDCPTRKWNGYVNWPIGASTCIGCTQFGFPDAMAPFVTYDTTRE
ncbi:hydrogenase small subunit [Brevibacillus sp. LEMMJ03]|jgi:hydrogenase small subunit|uniref:hydrogenase small subunit n=1 Tax=Brevibacillus sp. LEMMJ03 TaxID=2595056 RepID=UPI0005D106CD|nr:hydrogenase small subunit [Brevibacillus sp. LEMMJ03]TRY24965.1 hydrogenase small subunit [Brevibacillus sp. LEMMJ03]